MKITRDILQKRPLRRLDSLTRSQKTWAHNGLDSGEELRAIIERERARADRNGSTFSLVVFDIGDTDTEQNVMRRLTALISHRVRSTDEVGWIDTRRIGVNLPDTSAGGARKLAHDISQEVAIRKSLLTFKIYTYPLEWLSIYEWLNKPKQNDPNQRLTKTDTNARDASAIHFDKAKMQQCESLSDGLDPFFGLTMPAWKRGIDIFGSGLGLVLVFPLLLFIAILIKSVSSGPVLFKQERLGHLGKPFKCWKFRTMQADSHESEHKQHVINLMKSDDAFDKLDDDDLRIIPCGKLLRKTGLDELPQLLNILRGEMSLVGPRPEITYSAKHYAQWQKRRFDAVPGLTGLWQINGKNTTTFKRMIRWDITYIQRRSFWLDVKVLLKTPYAITAQAFSSCFKKKLTNNIRVPASNQINSSDLQQ
jgi:lipopolysaccharide/colanic/teichoic acid biosynthesis glycosyltransferase